MKWMVESGEEDDSRHNSSLSPRKGENTKIWLYLVASGKSKSLQSLSGSRPRDTLLNTIHVSVSKLSPVSQAQIQLIRRYTHIGILILGIHIGNRYTVFVLPFVQKKRLKPLPNPSDTKQRESSWNDRENKNKIRCMALWHFRVLCVLYLYYFIHRHCTNNLHATPRVSYTLKYWSSFFLRYPFLSYIFKTIKPFQFYFLSATVSRIQSDTK